MKTTTLYFLWRLLAVISAIGMICLLMPSCKITRESCQRKFPADTTVSTSVVIREALHDTILFSKTDSSFFEAMMQCDENNRIVVEELTRRAGMISHYEWTLDKIETEKKGENKYHAVLKCKCDSSAIYYAYRTRDTTMSTVKEIPRPYPVPANLTRWERFKVDWGDIPIGIVGMLVIGGLLYVGARVYGKFYGV